MVDHLQENFTQQSVWRVPKVWMALLGSILFHGVVIAMLIAVSVWLPSGSEKLTKNIRVALSQAQPIPTVTSEQTAVAEPIREQKLSPQLLQSPTLVTQSSRDTVQRSALAVPVHVEETVVPQQIKALVKQEQAPSKSASVEPVQALLSSADSLEQNAPDAVEDELDQLANLLAEARDFDEQDEAEFVEQMSMPDYRLGSVRNPNPEYPSIARRRGWEGDVLLGVNVASDGSVSDLKVLLGSGYPVLDEEARNTVADRWVFDPALAANVPTHGYIEVPISFRLQ